MFEALGGQLVIDKLVEDFYHIMRTDPAAKECLASHAGREMKESAEKLKAFLSGWLGGPPAYLEKYGHPRLRMRHFSFAIGEKEAGQWLYCMDKALQMSGINSQIQSQMMNAFEGVTKIIRNRD